MAKYAYIKIPIIGPPKMIFKETEDVSYYDFRDAVGGYFETVPVYELTGLILLVDEDGINKRLLPNFPATGLYAPDDVLLFGDVVLCRSGVNRYGEPDIMAIPLEKAVEEYGSIYAASFINHLKAGVADDYRTTAERTRCDSQEGEPED